MVVPVVVVGDVKAFCRAFAESEKVTFSGIPEVVVREGYIS